MIHPGQVVDGEIYFWEEDYHSSPQEGLVQILRQIDEEFWAAKEVGGWVYTGQFSRSSEGEIWVSAKELSPRQEVQPSKTICDCSMQAILFGAEHACGRSKEKRV